MPRIQVAGDISLRRSRFTQCCKTDGDDDDVHLVTNSRTHGNSFPPPLTFITPCLIKEK